MTTTVAPGLTQFAVDVAEGLAAEQKQLAARYFYDDLGSALFEAITLLPEYGLTRADERLLRKHASEIAAAVGGVSRVAELGSGSGKKTRTILESLGRKREQLVYQPIDVSAAALQVCRQALSDVSQVVPICHDWIDGLNALARSNSDSFLLLFLGSSIGNLNRDEIPLFLAAIRANLKRGDFFLLGADLVKNVDAMLAAYDDPTGVTAAFNLNVLGRINRELGADFDLRSFAHDVRWNEYERRIEMHLLSCREQSVYIGALSRSFEFIAGETIWTESSHKFSEPELEYYAKESGFSPLVAWVDREWPFAEALWQAN